MARTHDNPGDKVPRRILLLFLAVGFAFIAQMIWWIIFFIDTMREQIEQRHLTMLLMEGGFFIFLIIAGLYLIYRTIRQQVRLQQQFKDFFAGFSHELKTPIASVKLQAETLLARDLKKEQRSRLMENMLDDIERLELSIENILDVFRFESGKMKLDLEPIDIDSWIRETMEKMVQAFTDRGLVLRLDLSTGARVDLDERYFLTVLANIVQNCVRYTQGTPELTITSTVTEGIVKLSFADVGIGIDPADLDRVFEKYYRSQNENGLRWKGSGLGLFLSRRIVTDHGGRMWAESEGAGKGATFLITLPAVE